MVSCECTKPFYHWLIFLFQDTPVQYGAEIHRKSSILSFATCLPLCSHLLILLRNQTPLDETINLIENNPCLTYLWSQGNAQNTIYYRYQTIWSEYLGSQKAAAPAERGRSE